MSEQDDASGNVIHVRFGPGGGRRVEAEEPAPTAGAPEPTPAGGEEPYTQLFRRTEVARLFQLTEGRLRYWDRSGFLGPTGQVGRRRLYTFQDLVSIRVAKELLDGGAALPSVRRAIEALRKSLPHVTRPLNELRVTAEGPTVVVRDQARAYEPETGQLLLDFDVRTLRDEVVRVLRPTGADPERRRRAYERYLEGCRLDEEEATYDQAEACYREALELDPSLANALTNWGNLRFRRGDVETATDLYQRALELDEEQPEAYYNLGFLAYEDGLMEQAVALFRQAAHYDPGFADAHFNLAMALEELERAKEAEGHWTAYLELDPEGPWADIARRHLPKADR